MWAASAGGAAKHVAFVLAVQPTRNCTSISDKVTAFTGACVGELRHGLRGMQRMLRAMRAPEQRGGAHDFQARFLATCGSLETEANRCVMHALSFPEPVTELPNVTAPLLITHGKGQRHRPPSTAAALSVATIAFCTTLNGTDPGASSKTSTAYTTRVLCANASYQTPSIQTWRFLTCTTNL